MATASNQPNKEELYKLAAQTARNGQRQAARVMFQQVLQQDKRDVRVLLWLARLSEEEEDRVAWLNRVLQVDPTNEIALKALNKQETRDQGRRNRILFFTFVTIYALAVPVVALLWITLSIG